MATTQFPKLPDIKLSPFQGNYESWNSFIEIFNASVHDRSDLHEIQKFVYLKANCEGPAARLIDALEVTTENYAIALDLLRDRYENKRAIVTGHINGLLFGLPDVTKETATGLRNLVDTVNAHLKALEKQSLPTSEWDALLVPLIVKKLDNTTRKEWQVKQPVDKTKLPTLKELNDFLSKKCFNLEIIHQESVKVKIEGKFEGKTSSKGPRDSDRSNKLYQTFATTQNNDHSARKQNCSYCDSEEHRIYTCDEFKSLSVAERNEQVRKLKLCSNCLRNNHFKRNCTFTSTCSKCKSKHHTFLHESEQRGININVGEESAVNKPDHTTTLVTTSENPMKASTSDVTNCHAYSTSFIKETLLSTAKVLIADARGNYHDCTALLDSGSQCNLISKQMFNLLKLDISEEQVTPIVGINHTTTNVYQATNATIKSHSGTFQTKLEFLVVPTITGKLPRTYIDKRLLKLPSNIQLADEEFHQPKTIDILIGASIFYELMEQAQIKLGENLPILQGSVFGWIITGSISQKRQSLETRFCNFLTNEALNEILLVN